MRLQNIGQSNFKQFFQYHNLRCTQQAVSQQEHASPVDEVVLLCWLWSKLNQLQIFRP